jgi:4-hydroxybenzoate polyprenyltransferase
MKPLCVDLDGTLIYSDTLLECLILLTKHKPWLLLYLPFWLCHGRTYFKHKIAHHITLDPVLLPYHHDLLQRLQQAHKKNRPLYLVTAAHQNIADAVSQHVGLFTKAFGSSKNQNLKGNTKRDFLNETFGKGNYDYAGNSSADLPIFKDAHKSIIVNGSDRLIKKMQTTTQAYETLEGPKLTLKDFLKGIRIHQYTKNALIFVPLILGYWLTHLHLIEEVILGFIALSLTASSVYLTNDLLDLTADRQHPTKQKRALASGKLSLAWGCLLCPTFLILGILVSIPLPQAFKLVLLSYYLLTLAYSFGLKSIALLDVYTLALLYTFRILAGMAIIGAGYSSWLLIFSLFFFTSLAFVKRYIELNRVIQTKQKVIYGRNYHIKNTNIIAMFGVASGFLAVLVFAFYLSSSKALSIYTHPEGLYLICPALLYWLSRIWLKASQNQIDEDPIAFALRDKASYLLLGFIILSAILSAS